MKQGELFQIDKIIPFLRVTFGKNGHSAADDDKYVAEQLPVSAVGGRNGLQEL